MAGPAIHVFASVLSAGRNDALEKGLKPYSVGTDFGSLSRSGAAE
jgi:hypothetical protein